MIAPSSVRGLRARARRVAAALLLAVSTLSGAAAADGRFDADQHFRRGVDLYKDRDYAAALVEFQRAYEIQADTKTLYNIAELQGLLQDYAGALASFRRYLNEGGKRLPAQRRRDVEREIDKLRQRVATLTVTTSEPGALVSVDDVPAGKTPLANPIVVSAGKRRITATLAGRPPVTEVLQLAGGDARTVALSIPALQVKVVTREAPSIAAPLIAWTATGVLTTGAVVTGIFALSASSDLKAQLAAYPASAKAITAAHDKALAFGITNDVLSVLAVATGGVSIWLTVRRPRPADDAAPAGAPAARIVLRPGGAGVAGTF